MAVSKRHMSGSAAESHLAILHRSAKIDFDGSSAEIWVKRAFRIDTIWTPCVVKQNIEKRWAK